MDSRCQFEAHRGLTFDRQVLLELGRTVAADATQRLGLPASPEWRVDVLHETSMPAGTRVLTAVEVRPECPGRSACATALRLWIVAAFTTAATAEISVSYARGHTGAQPPQHRSRYIASVAAFAPL